MSLIDPQAKPEEKQPDPPIKVADESKRFTPSGGERPEYVPEKFWKDGKPDLENMGKSYVELERNWNKKTEDLKTELDAARFKERPEAADKYELPKPEGVDMDELTKHPMVAWWRDHAFSHGLDQKAFQDGINTYIKAGVAVTPDLDAERKNLGENADTRIQAVSAWANKNFQGDEFALVQKYGQTAAGIGLLEKMMKLGASSGSAGDTGAPKDPPLTHEALIKMQNDPRYWDASKRDIEFVKKVEEGYKQLFPDKKKA